MAVVAETAADAEAEAAAGAVACVSAVVVAAAVGEVLAAAGSTAAAAVVLAVLVVEAVAVAAAAEVDLAWAEVALEAPGPPAQLWPSPGASACCLVFSAWFLVPSAWGGLQAASV